MLCGKLEAIKWQQSKRIDDSQKIEKVVQKRRKRSELAEDGREQAEEDETRRNTLTEGGKTQQQCSAALCYLNNLPLFLLTILLLSRENGFKILVHFFIMFVLEK